MGVIKRVIFLRFIHVLKSKETKCFKKQECPRNSWVNGVGKTVTFTEKANLVGSFANTSGYTITATLASGYRWSDNATGTKTFKCPMAKPTPT